MKIIDYRVIEGYNLKAFQAKVLEALQEGYSPSGAVAVTRGSNGESYYFQAIILESDD
jgi:hypothetical protein